MKWCEVEAAQAHEHVNTAYLMTPRSGFKYTQVGAGARTRGWAAAAAAGGGGGGVQPRCNDANARVKKKRRSGARTALDAVCSE
jgi:hypothetical protein